MLCCASKRVQIQFERMNANKIYDFSRFYFELLSFSICWLFSVEIAVGLLYADDCSCHIFFYQSMKLFLYVEYLL